jgi:hypothetical protein
MLVSTEEQLGVLRARDVLRVVLRFVPGLGTSAGKRMECD